MSSKIKSPGSRGVGWKTRTSVYSGLLLGVLAGSFNASVSAIVKLMTDIHPGQLAVYRFLAVLTFCLPELVRCGQSPLGPKDYRYLLYLRGFCVATTEYLGFTAFRYLPLGVAAVITRSFPVFVTLFARLCLREPCGLFQSLALSLTMVGVLLGSEIHVLFTGSTSSYDEYYIYGILAAVGSVFANAVRALLLRKLQDVHSAVINFNDGFISVALCAALTALFGDFRPLDCGGGQQGLLLALVVCAYAGQTLFIVAMQSEHAGPISNLVAVCNLTISFLWQTFFFRDAPDASMIAGAALVAVSGAFIGLRKWALSAPEGSTVHRRLKWLRS